MELTFYVEYEVKETFSETITIEFAPDTLDDDAFDFIDEIKEDCSKAESEIDYYFSNNFEPIVLGWRDCTLTKIEHVKDGE